MSVIGATECGHDLGVDRWIGCGLSEDLRVHFGVVPGNTAGDFDYSVVGGSGIGELADNSGAFLAIAAGEVHDTGVFVFRAAGEAPSHRQIWAARSTGDLQGEYFLGKHTLYPFHKVLYPCG